MSDRLEDYDGIEGSGIDDIRKCHWPNCDAPALHEMRPFKMGTTVEFLDRQRVDVPVYARKWHCAKGHHYQVEEPR